MKPACALLVALALTLPVTAQINQNGTTPLPSKIVESNWNPNCSMTDIGQEFFNARSTVCAIPGQTQFFNGEARFVDAGEGVVASATLYNGYELTSCACSQNGTWTRTMENVFNSTTTFIRWTWKFYARNDDCSLTLKRDLIAHGCWYPMQCNCPEGTTCGTRDSEECLPLSPIAIDLDGDGLRLTDRAHGVEFDLNGDGESGRVPWLKEDGWLVLNDYEDGIIRDGRQLFGDKSAQVNREGKQPNGYAALRTFDDNHNDFIDSTDGVWRLLGIWRDLNHDGLSQRGEVVSLDSLGITAISLDYKESRRLDPHGNELRYHARVWWASGRHTSSWDVFLTAD